MRAVLSFILSASCLGVFAQSNIDPLHSISGSDFIGQFQWRPDPYGAVINQYYCSGYVYGSDVGWISLGTGEPANKIQYSNASAQDYGVNVDSSGTLRGFAYGANIGWINFESTGNPKVDWVSGKLSGRIYSANAGWINLAESSNYLRITKIPSSPDSDGDGLPDAWEIAMAGNLATLSAGSDADHDGISDFDEFIAGTSPVDPEDFLGVAIEVAANSSKSIQWQSKPSVLYRLERREAFDVSSPWEDAGKPTLVGTGGVLSVALDAESSDMSFYRVTAYLPLTQLN